MRIKEPLTLQKSLLSSPYCVEFNSENLIFGQCSAIISAVFPIIMKSFQGMSVWILKHIRINSPVARIKHLYVLMYDIVQITCELSLSLGEGGDNGWRAKQQTAAGFCSRPTKSGGYDSLVHGQLYNDQTKYSKPKHDVSLTLTDGFLCLNLTPNWPQHYQNVKLKTDTYGNVNLQQIWQASRDVSMVCWNLQCKHLFWWMGWEKAADWIKLRKIKLDFCEKGKKNCERKDFN